MTRAVALVLLLLSTRGGAALAQDADEVPTDAIVRRALAMPVREAPPDEPTVLPEEPAPPDPMLAAHLAFHATLDVVSPDRERALRLDAARRVAPMDLSWGLGD